MSQIFFIFIYFIIQFSYGADSTSNSKYKTACQNQPETYKKIMDELEKKSLCMTGLSPDQCYTLFLAKGGAAVGGSLAALAALKSGYLQSKDAICTAHLYRPQNIWDILLPQAQALSCQINSFAQKKELVKKYLEALRAELQQQKSDIAQTLSEQTKQLSGNTSSTASNQAQQLVKQWQANEQKMKDLLDNTLYDLESQAANTTDRNMLNTLKNEIQKIESARNQLLRAPGNPDAFRAALNSSSKYLSGSDKVELSKTLTYSDQIKQLNAEAAKNVTRSVTDLSNLDTEIKALANSSGTNQAFYEKMSTLVRQKVPGLDSRSVEALFDTATKYRALNNQQITAADQMLSRISLAQNEKALASFVEQMPVRMVFNPTLDVLASRVATTLGSQVSPTLTRVLSGGGRVILGAGAAVLGTAAMAATYTSDMSCRNKKSDEVVNKEAALALNYMLFDDNCNIIPTLNENSNKFFELDSASRLKLVQASPELCDMITEMSKDLLTSAHSDIKCTANGFTLTDKNNSKESRTIEYGDNANYTVSITTSNNISPDCKSLSVDPTQAEISKTNSNCSFKKNLSNQMSYNNIRSIAQGCDEKTTKFASTCKVYKDEITRDMYDYAQIAKCCSGNDNNYCDIGSMKSSSGSQTNSSKSFQNSSSGVNRRQ